MSAPRHLLFALLLGFLLPTSLDAKTHVYRIRFQRPFKVGDRLLVESSGTFRKVSKTRLGSRSLRPRKSFVVFRYKAILTILKVSQNGTPLQESQKILTYERKGTTSWTSVLPPGTNIHASSHRQKKIFLYKGKPLQGTLRELPASVSRTERIGGPSDEDIFGTRIPKRIGERWTVNKALAAKSLSRSNISIRGKDLRGSTKLEKLVRAQGKMCLRLRGKIAISNLRIKLPPMFTRHRGSAEVHLEGDFPLDRSLPVLGFTKRMKVLYETSGIPQKGAPTVTVKLTMENFVRATFTLLQQTPAKP